MWTEFWDMQSGGTLKEKWQYIYIEAPERKARVVFYNRFDHNPNRVTCTCCGEDYVIRSASSLEQLTGFHRGCAVENDQYVEKPDFEGWEPYQTLAQYKQRSDVLVIPSSEIKPEEYQGSVPTQGYIWVG